MSREGPLNRNGIDSLLFFCGGGGVSVEREGPTVYAFCLDTLWRAELGCVIARKNSVQSFATQRVGTGVSLGVKASRA